MTALQAEWTKLRTAPGTIWLFLAIVALTVGVSAAGAATIKCPPGECTFDPAKSSLTGVILGQTIIAILAVLAIGGEYSTGMIRTSLTATPRRTRMLVAKATVVAGVALAAAIGAVSASVLAAKLILPSRGIGAPSLADGPVLRATVGSVLYLGLIALMSLGIATAARDSATAIGIVLALLYVLPLVSLAVSDPHWRRHLEQISPMSAGLAVQATVELSKLPIGPWAGLGVLAAWAGGTMLLGWAVLQFRDA
jgi:ABC-2 type transport system permease protein